MVSDQIIIVEARTALNWQGLMPLSIAMSHICTPLPAMLLPVAGNTNSYMQKAVTSTICTRVLS